jgi:hypothetical protein
MIKNYLVVIELSWLKVEIGLELELRMAPQVVLPHVKVCLLQAILSGIVADISLNYDF